MIYQINPILNFQTFAGHKHHLVYDDLGNIIEQYYANWDTEDNGFCWKVSYAYDNSRIVGIQETQSQWNSAWDFAN